MVLEPKNNIDDLILVQGNEAGVWGAIASGCGFFAGYPITPASEIAELMARRLPFARRNLYADGG